MPELTQRRDLIRLPLVAESLSRGVNEPPPAGVVALLPAKVSPLSHATVHGLPILPALASVVSHPGVLARVRENGFEIVLRLPAAEELRLAAARMVEARGDGARSVVNVDAAARCPGSNLLEGDDAEAWLN